MLPNLVHHDLVILRKGGIDVTTAAENQHKAFHRSGDVIVFWPYGSHEKGAIAHRVLYFVKRGEPMWPRGPPAPHAGYITKGDNNDRNDQQSSIARNSPVKPEWIIGVAKARIPLLGLISELGI